MVLYIFKYVCVCLLAPTVENSSCASDKGKKHRSTCQTDHETWQAALFERLNLSWIRNVQCMHVWIAVEFIRCLWLFKFVWFCMRFMCLRENNGSNRRKKRYKTKFQNLIFDSRHQAFMPFKIWQLAVIFSTSFYKTVSSFQSIATGSLANKILQSFLSSCRSQAVGSVENIHYSPRLQWWQCCKANSAEKWIYDPWSHFTEPIACKTQSNWTFCIF